MRVASALLLIVFLVGCGADPFANSQASQQPPGRLPAPPRLAVTDTLRAACPLVTDAEIRDLLEAAEHHRLDGLTEQQQLDMMLLDCATRGNPPGCDTCAVAVLRQIYDL